MTAVPNTVATGERTIVDLLAGAPEPEAPAVCAAGDAVSYRCLDRSARLVAHWLAQAGIGRGDVVAVACDGAAESVIGMLGVMLAGAAFLPVEGDPPSDRLRRTFAAAGVETVLVRPGCPAPVPGVTALEVHRTVEDIPAPDTRPAPEDPAYVIFTSGSTGTPKGVVVEHAALLEHVHAVIELLRLDARSVVLQFASLGFDVALEEIWPTLAVGGRLVLRGDRLWSLPELVEVTDQESITVWQLPTAYWTAMTHDLAGRRPVRCPRSLATVVIGGEAADTGTARTWLSTGFGAARLVNGYGPTEGVITATAWDSTVHPVGDGPYLPLGVALRGRAAIVVDDGLRPVDRSQVGELVLTGPCMARGYLGEQAATERAFRRLPDGTRALRTGDRAHADAAGVLHFHGRADRQVKIGGVRVELGEVEAALLRCPGVLAASVVDTGTGSARQLVAHVVHREAAADPRALTRAVRAQLAGQLTAAAIPARVQPHQELPRNASGKVDHAALRASSVIGGQPSREESA